MEDKIITCTACGAEFIFSAADQEFFANKGFQEPRKCKPCRQAAKSQRGGGYGGGGYGSGYDRPPRQLYDTVCSACGITTQVPFQPKGDRPVYCRDCYKDVAPR